MNDFFIRTGASRDGLMFDEEKTLRMCATLAVNGFHLIGRAHQDERNEGDIRMGDVTKAYKDAAKMVEDAADIYNSAIGKFRSTIKNDLASISSSADRVTREHAKVSAAYQATAQMLISPDMAIAIDNAERLARALESIAALKSHSLTFAVLDKKTV